jgi:hypothetical protein
MGGGVTVGATGAVARTSAGRSGSMGTQTLLTLEQFDQLPIVEGVRYELGEGELATMTEPMPRHNVVRDNIAAVLRDFVRPRKVGRVLLRPVTSFHLKLCAVPTSRLLRPSA